MSIYVIEMFLKFRLARGVGRWLGGGEGEEDENDIVILSSRLIPF